VEEIDDLKKAFRYKQQAAKRTLNEISKYLSDQTYSIPTKLESV
jgi:uncharacterized damage-inducible protein DinB